MSETRLYSIGHSNHTLARLLQLLENAGVTAVADVRSQPFSQRQPHFNRPELERELQRVDIAYGFLGRQLGGRPERGELYDAQGRVHYERVRATAVFHEGLDQLCRALEQFTVAMLCSEEDPLDCHRGLMIAPSLIQRGINPFHLRGDGSIESTAEFEARLLQETGVGSGILDGLFSTMISEEEREGLLAEAYRRQSHRRAFQLRPAEREYPA